MRIALMILVLLSIGGALFVATRKPISGTGDGGAGEVLPAVVTGDIEKRQVAGKTMGGAWSVQAMDFERADFGQQIQRELDEVEAKMSTWRADSELSRFNASRSTDWIGVSEQLVHVVRVAQDVNKASGGAFDITVGPVVNLWGFGPTGRITAPPTDEQIASARKHVGAEKLAFRASPPALRKSDPDAYVDLSAIAKGYAADQVAAHLERLGISNYLVAVGGENRGKGVSQTGRPWHIGIENPTADVMRIMAIVELPDCAVSTSGDYRNFVQLEGKRFSHEIDPRTGRPVAHKLASVTVIDKSGTRADALATGLFVLGPEEGLAAAKRLKLPAMFIERGEGKFEIHKTPEFDSYIVH